MIWASDVNCRTVYLSHQWEDFTGQSVADGQGSRWTDVVHPEDVEVVRSTFLDACAAASSFWMTYRLKRKDRSYQWVLSGANPSHDVLTGAFNGFLGSINAIQDGSHLAAVGQLAAFRPELPAPETPPKSHLEMIVDLALVAHAAALEGGEASLLSDIERLLDRAKIRLTEELGGGPTQH